MRVICVDDSPGYTTGLPSGLVKWKEYNVYPCGHRRHFDGGTDIASKAFHGIAETLVGARSVFDQSKKST